MEDLWQGDTEWTHASPDTVKECVGVGVYHIKLSDFDFPLDIMYQGLAYQDI